MEGEQVTANINTTDIPRTISEANTNDKQRQSKRTTRVSIKIPLFAN